MFEILVDDLLVEPFIEKCLSSNRSGNKGKSLLVEGEEAIYGSVISKDKRIKLANLVIDPPQPNKEANLEVTIDYVLEYSDKAKNLLRDLGNGISIGVLFAFFYTIFFIAPLISFLNVKIPTSTQQQVNLSRKIAIFSLSNKRSFSLIIPLSSLLMILLIPMNKLDMNPTQMYSEKYTIMDPMFYG